MDLREKFEARVGELHFPAIYTPRHAFGKVTYEVNFPEGDLPEEARRYPIRVNDRGLVRASSMYAPLVNAFEGLDKLAAVLAEADISNLGRDRAFIRCPAVLRLSVYEYSGRNSFGSFHGYGLALHALAFRVGDVRESLRQAMSERWA